MLERIILFEVGKLIMHYDDELIHIFRSQLTLCEN